MVSNSFSQVATMQQCQFFDAIENNDLKLVKLAIRKGADVNIPSRKGTALYRSVKQHNFEMIEFLVDQGADCNAVHLHFDFNQPHSIHGTPRVCFFNTPIDLLCKENKAENNHILQYLLQKRSIVNEDMIDQRIEYCKRLSTVKDQETLFDYVTSYFLRQNMYTHIYPLEAKTIYTLLAGALNFDATIDDAPLNDGGTHTIFLTIMIRSLFEELVHFKLDHKPRLINSPEQYKCVLDELLHNLETYNFLKDLDQVPYESRESVNPSTVENITTKLKNMKNKGEYTLPIEWYTDSEYGHAVCLNFVHESDSIIIRIDNLYR